MITRFRRSQVVLLLGFLAIALATGCSSNDADKRSSARPKRHQLATPPTFPDGASLAVTEPTPGAELSDGRYIAKIVSIDEDNATVDFVGWLSGEAAEDTPGGFMLVNEHPEEEVLPIADDVAVTSVWADYEILGEIRAVTISLQSLIAYFKNPRDLATNIVADPYWITLENGRISRLDEQYVP